ncbi:MAG: hypothetical protein BWY17_04444 [Deltaproteobacteria bacterium ADurb.Bin207]|nr:MAG: hypothetical protein BWY17_04444 [Deltaproteobacteria bacterium ADurb.Bin207]
MRRPNLAVATEANKRGDASGKRIPISRQRGDCRVHPDAVVELERHRPQILDLEVPVVLGLGLMHRDDAHLAQLAGLHPRVVTQDRLGRPLIVGVGGAKPKRAVFLGVRVERGLKLAANLPLRHFDLAPLAG